MAVLTLLFTAVLCVRLACGVFPRGLRLVFGETGMPGLAILRVVWLCGRSRVAQRMFFEFALVKSRGAKMSAREWGKIVDDFAIFLGKAEGGSVPVLEAKNCTHLTERAFSQAVERYFGFLAKGRAVDFYSIGRFDDCWHTPIRVEEAYVTPSVLLSGLLSAFDSDWEMFIDQYRRTLAMHGRNGVSAPELYGVFSWLLWGPSREVDWRDHWDGLCQMAYGDENNSLPLCAPSGTPGFEVLRKAFGAAEEKGGFGGLFSVDVRLVPKADFFRHERLGMDVRNAYFIDKLSANDRLSFIPRVEGAKAAVAGLAEAYYCTAYLWVLFERDEGDEAFHPESAVAFFEHANLADASVCRFLRDRLVEKALAHFRDVAGQAGTSERRYRFVCGVNASLERYCRDRFVEAAGGVSEFAEWLRGHVALEGRLNPLAAFAALDDFCQQNEPALEFRDIDPCDRLACAELALFHAGIYTEAFPNDDERESLSNFLRYLKNSRKVRNWDFRVLLAKDGDGVVVGGIVFDYFRDLNSMVVEFICVDKTRRRMRIGERLWREALHVADNLAGKKGVASVFCEVDSPAISRDKAMGHLKFWRTHGFGRLDFTYIQPALEEGLQPVKGLWWIGLERLSKTPGCVDSSLLEKVLHHYIHFAMGIAIPENNSSFNSMKQQLSAHKSIKILPL